jgi:hypothetical protein
MMRLTLRWSMLLTLIVGLAGCAGADHRPLPRVVFSSGKGIALQSSPGGAVHYYQFKRGKR